MPTIFFNGIQYPYPQDMPPEVRQAYEQALGMLADRDGNGLPDIFDRMAGQGMPDAGLRLGHSSTTIVVDGQVYSSPDDLPAEARQKYEQASAAWDANRDGIPDLLEDMLGGQSAPVVPAPPAAARPSPIPPPADPLEGGLDLRSLLLGAAFVVLLGVIVGLVLVFTGVIHVFP